MSSNLAQPPCQKKKNKKHLNLIKPLDTTTNLQKKKEDRATCIMTPWKYNQQNLDSEKLQDK